MASKFDNIKRSLNMLAKALDRLARLNYFNRKQYPAIILEIEDTINKILNPWHIFWYSCNNSQLYKMAFHLTGESESHAYQARLVGVNLCTAGSGWPNKVARRRCVTRGVAYLFVVEVASLPQQSPRITAANRIHPRPIGGGILRVFVSLCFESLMMFM